jgi:hypothetical protein
MSSPDISIISCIDSWSINGFFRINGLSSEGAPPPSPYTCPQTGHLDLPRDPGHEVIWARFIQELGGFNSG